MLALDSTIGCIEVAESEVLDLFRSAPVTRSPSPGSRPESMEAHLCAIRKKTLVKVYLAFVVNDRKIFVYTAPGKGTSEAEYSRDLEEALECARAMGFSPERVDLSYSPAMREVVVRNSKILRLPGAKGAAALKQGQAGAPTLPMSQKGASRQTPPPEPPIVPSPTPLITPAVQAPQSSGPDVGEALKQAQAEFGKAQQALLAERDALAAQLQQLSLLHQQDAAELPAAREACAALTAEKQTLLRQARQAEEELRAKEVQAAQALDDAVALAARLETMAQQQTRMEQEHEAMVENLAQARQDLAQLAEEREAALESERKAGARQRETDAKLAEAHRELERLGREREEAQERLTEFTQEKERLEQELAELRRVLSEAEAAQDAARSLAPPLEEQEATAEREADDLRGELQRIGEERDDALRRAAASDEKLSINQAELADLRRELELVRGELELVRGELDQALKPAAAPQAEESPTENWPYRPHIDSPKVQLKDEGARPSPLPLPPNPAFGDVARFEEFDVPLEERDWSATHPSSGAASAADVEFPPPGQEASFFVPLGELAGGGFNSGSDDGAPVLFMLESGLSAIEVRSTEDVLELHHSINNAYLAPEGTGGQENCQGYICCVRKGETKEVFAAIYGTQSKRTRVYLPEEQPRDDDSYARTVRGAISFAEEVGLMMEPVPLDGSAAKKMERLKRCPALRLMEPA